MQAGWGSAKQGQKEKAWTVQWSEQDSPLLPPSSVYESVLQRQHSAHKNGIQEKLSGLSPSCPSSPSLFPPPSTACSLPPSWTDILEETYAASPTTACVAWTGARRGRKGPSGGWDGGWGLDTTATTSKSPHIFDTFGFVVVCVWLCKV